uniref:Uncharacterized protein LOC101509702 n=1 Tax=Cicer arietinum TaxID=3827 RepID=A0A1S2XS28_CICAR|nr:uncharacterized protein LOC101509702 [Cicer arietinum]
MAKLHRTFPPTILIGVALLALLSNNAKTIVARFVPLTTSQTNDNQPQNPTCLKLGCIKEHQNNLNPTTHDRPLQHGNVNHIFRESLEGPYVRHHKSLRPNNIDRILRESPSGPDPHHHH